MKKTTQKATLTTTQKPAKKDLFNLTPTQMQRVLGGQGLVASATGGSDNGSWR